MVLFVKDQYFSFKRKKCLISYLLIITVGFSVMRTWKHICVHDWSACVCDFLVIVKTFDWKYIIFAFYLWVNTFIKKKGRKPLIKDTFDELTREYFLSNSLLIFPFNLLLMLYLSVVVQNFTFTRQCTPIIPPGQSDTHFLLKLLLTVTKVT